MTNNNSYDKFNAVNKQRLKNVEVGLECSVNLEVNEPVSKILAVNVEGECNHVEALTSEASVSGNVIVSLVYLTQQGLVNSVMYTSPFMCKLIDSKITPSSNVFAKVVSAIGQVHSLANNIAKVDCMLTICGYMLNNEEVTYLKSAGDDVCTLMEESSYETLCGVCKNSWVENIEVDVKEPVNRVLTSTCSVHVKNVEPANNYVTVTCELVNKILYLTEEETPVLKTVYTKSEVKQEVECEYSNKESKVELDVFVQKNEVKNTISEKENDIKISIEIPLDVCIRVYENKSVNLICDLYSTSNLTTTTNVSFENSIVCQPIYFDKKVEGSLTLGDDEPRIDKLLAVNYSKAIVTNEYIEAGQYSVSGVISSNLIYFNEDDNMVNSVDVEIPFVVSTQTDYEGEYLTDLEVIVEDVDVMVKKGKDVFVDALIKVRTKVCNTVQGVVTSELEYQDAIPQKDCAIEIYFAKAGEKVWDIAKRLFVMPETIYNQNPELPEVLEHDEQLAIYYKKIN